MFALDLERQFSLLLFLEYEPDSCLEELPAYCVQQLILSTSFMFMSFAALCMSDMTLVLFETLAFVLIYFGALTEKRRDLSWFLAALAMGLAFLTKGPIGIVLPGITGLVFLLSTRQANLIRPKHLLLALLISLIVAAPWFLMAFKANGAWSMIYFFVHENLSRYTGSDYDTHKPVWFMVQSLFAGFAPWCIVLPLALFDFLKQWKASGDKQALNSKLYLWLWIAITTSFSVFRGANAITTGCLHTRLPHAWSLHILLIRSVSEPSQACGLPGFFVWD